MEFRRLLILDCRLRLVVIFHLVFPDRLSSSNQRFRSKLKDPAIRTLQPEIIFIILLQLPSQVGAKLQRFYPIDMIGETYHIPMIVCTFAIHFRRLKPSHPQEY